MSTLYIKELSSSGEMDFPNTKQALTEPNGLLAFGGDLSVQTLLKAYSLGIFPWFSQDDPILWWSPSPRAILHPDNIKISRSLFKSYKNKGYLITIDKAFSQVIQSCSKSMPGREDTWITKEMKTAYAKLHDASHAHSLEVWYKEELIGGLYGVSIGKVFFGESMFSTKTDASKVALVHLCKKLKEWGYDFIDCQVESPHIMSLGAELQSREIFEKYLRKSIGSKPHASAWQG